jgi:hypothetical protein
MWYIVRRNQYNDYLFWNAHHKNFRYAGGSAYASFNGAKAAFRAILQTYGIDPVGIEIASTETILNSYNRVTSCNA